MLRKNGQTVSEDNYPHTYHEILNGHTICSPFLVSDVIELGSWKVNIGDCWVYVYRVQTVGLEC